MKEHLPKIIIVGLVVAIVGIPLLMRGGGDVSATPDGATQRLIIYTPHNEQIRFEFGAAFNRYRVAQGKAPVAFDWRSSGGTSDLRKQMLSQYEAVAKRGGVEAIDTRGIGADLFFGGGEYEHSQLIKGIEVGDERYSVSRPVVLPEGLIAEAFPEPLIGGEKRYHPELYWVGTTLSSFGIVYNRDVLAMNGLPEPTTWADLAVPALIGEVALADPGHSGSIAVTYETIVKRMGWHEGWGLLRRVFANSRYFTSSSSKVPVDISAGEATAGMCIDFYGRFQSGAIADAQGNSRVGYVDPVGLTATTADPISVLRGAPSPKLADEFVAWTLTKDAQRLWQYQTRDETGLDQGPLRYELRRQPIRADLFVDQERAHFTDPQIDPFGQAVPMPDGVPSYYSFIAPVCHAMAIDAHDDLRAAWLAMERAGPDHPNRARMLELFDAMPPELTVVWSDQEMAAGWSAMLHDVDHPRHDEVVAVLNDFKASIRARWKTDDDKLADRLAWGAFFAGNYREVVRLARE